MKRAAVLGLMLASCAAERAAPPSPVEAVSVAPHGTGSPNEPVLLVPPRPQTPDAPDGFVRVPVREERPDASFRPPKDRCPGGLVELIGVHVPLDQAMELLPGASPVLALGAEPEAVEVLYSSAARVVRVVARKNGLVYVLVERDNKCVFYGVNAGY